MIAFPKSPSPPPSFTRFYWELVRDVAFPLAVGIGASLLASGAWLHTQNF